MCFFHPTFHHAKSPKLIFSDFNGVFPQILVDSQSISFDFLSFSIRFSQLQSVLINFNQHIIGGSQKGGFQKGGFGGCSPGTKTGTRVRSPKPPFWKPPFYLPMTLFGVDKRVVSKRVVSADVPPERKPERGYVRQNHPFTKPPFYLPVKVQSV